jgi:hypothetical protein
LAILPNDSEAGVIGPFSHALARMMEALRRMLAPDAACSYIRAKPSSAATAVAERDFL